MQNLIGLFQQHSSITWDTYWTLEKVGGAVQVEHDTWPRYRDSGDSWAGPERPAAIGIVTLKGPGGELGMWRAECEHPDGGEMVAVGRDRDAALAELGRLVRARR